MVKHALIICSSLDGTDYPLLMNQTMLTQLLGEGFVPHFMGKFPDELERGTHTYDIIMFAGCNQTSWLFATIKDSQDPVRYIQSACDKLYNLLKRNGSIVFTEGSKYIKARLGAEHLSKYKLTLTLDELHASSYMKLEPELFTLIQQAWGKHFIVKKRSGYILYAKKMKTNKTRKIKN